MTTSGDSDFTSLRRALRRHACTLRRDLPWIGHEEPWAILVSEVMLQQTQVARVIDPWRRFLATFPTPADCAAAPLSQVLQLWAGLGYHRRAKALHDAARMIRDDFAGEVPRSPSVLRTLPGVGDYTANAVASFAYGERVAVLDTNVGRVLARALANRRLSVAEARDAATRLLPLEEVARFNQAMLDLGAQYCRASPRCTECPIRRACRWNREGGPDPAPQSAGVSRAQSRFDGSDRQIRGKILAILRDRDAELVDVRRAMAPVDASRIDAMVERLIDDGLVQRRSATLALAGS